MLLLLILVAEIVNGQPAQWDPSLVLGARQRRTAMDIQAIWRACESYRQDHGSYPAAATIDALEPLVSPLYILHLPKKDAWDNPFVYITDEARGHIRVISGADDLKVEKASLQIQTSKVALIPVYASRPEQDLIFQDGFFIQAPPEIINRFNRVGPPN